MQYQIEYTDTFGGEANYCWLKRAPVRPTAAFAFFISSRW